ESLFFIPARQRAGRWAKVTVGRTPLERPMRPDDSAALSPNNVATRLPASSPPASAACSRSPNRRPSRHILPTKNLGIPARTALRSAAIRGSLSTRVIYPRTLTKGATAIRQRRTRGRGPAAPHRTATARPLRRGLRRDDQCQQPDLAGQADRLTPAGPRRGRPQRAGTPPGAIESKRFGRLSGRHSHPAVLYRCAVE